MLKGLLEKRTCAKCRVCCGFDRSDIWEMPVMDTEAAEKIKKIKPETEFVKIKNDFVVKAPELHDDELYFCPALGENGCILGDEKPFDCRIWPYRIMDIGGKYAITISPVCSELYHRPLSELVEFLEKGLADYIFEYALKHPDVVKKYDESYPVLKMNS
ncbi:MAG: hypothetical protein ACI4I9_09650 [Porcipelethomonas sp.]